MFLLIIGVYLLYLWLKKRTNQSKVNFINSCLPKTLIHSKNPEPGTYKIYIPIKTYNIRKKMTMPRWGEVKFDGPLRVDISLIYFVGQNEYFFAKSTKIDYGLDELHSIFKRASRSPNKRHKICDHWDYNNLIIYPDGSVKSTELKRLSDLFSQMQYIENDIFHVEEEKKLIQLLSASLVGLRAGNSQP